VSAFGVTDDPSSESSRVGGGIRWEEPMLVTVVSVVAACGSSQTVTGVTADMGAVRSVVFLGFLRCFVAANLVFADLVFITMAPIIKQSDYIPIFQYELPTCSR
jgi:hypothetical protein